MSELLDENKEVEDLFAEDSAAEGTASEKEETPAANEAVPVSTEKEADAAKKVVREEKKPSTLALFDELSKEEYKDIVGPERAKRDPRKRDIYMYMESEAERQLNEKTNDELEREYKAARKEAQKRIKTAERHEKDTRRRTEDKKRDQNDFIQSENHRRNAEKKKRRRAEKARAKRAKEAAAENKRYHKNERKLSVDYHKRKQSEERRVAELKKKNTEPQAKRPLWKSFVEFLCYVVGVIALSFFIINFVAQQSIIVGDSMLPNLHNGEHVLLEKVSYTFGDPDRFDVIVFNVPNDDGKNYVKRVIGLPGETVQIVDGVIYINGEVLEEDYGLETMIYAGLATDPITVGEDEYFVLGDNRNDSTDSRFERVGMVQEDQIVGHAVVRIWPLTAISGVH